MNRLAILGAGSWGTALAGVLAPRFESVRLWVYERDLAVRIERERENPIYLPGYRLPANVCAFADVQPVLEGAEVVLSVVPSHVVRTVFGSVLPFLRPEMLFVSATKGLENGTLFRMTEV